MNRSGSNDLVIQNNTWSGASNNVDYNESFTYDANGNILTLTRYGTSAQQQSMDDLTYNYYSGTNRLEYVEDIVDPDNYTTDIDDQNTGNYTYDEIGNLKSDVQEEIANIDWTVYGKIKSVTRTASSTKDDLEFKYDASGNRIAKIVKPHGSAPSAWTTTYYTRDASGNIMATYQDKQNDADLYLQEQNLFGSSRLGVFNRDLNLTSPLATTPNIFTHTLGKKSYELSNHLGNVLAVVSDRKIPHNNGGTIDYYNASLISANDYYTFGSTMPGRSFTSNTYRYGFNKMEKDDEIKGNGNSYDYGARIYDPRIGRWLSLDPLAAKFPFESPYNFSHNSPLIFTDPNGKDPITAILDAMTAFAVDASLSFVGNMMAGDKAQDAFNKIDWTSAAIEAGKSYAMSLFISGVGSVKALEKFGNSKVGKIAAATVINATGEIMKKYYAGAFNDEDGDFDISKLANSEIWMKALEDGFTEAIASAGFDKKADKAKGKLEKSLKEMEKQEDKLAKNLKSRSQGKTSQKALDNRYKKVNQAQKEVLKNMAKSSGTTAVGELIETGAGEAKDKAKAVIADLPK